MPLTSLADRGNRLKAFVEGNKTKASSQLASHVNEERENARSPTTTDDDEAAGSVHVSASNTRHNGHLDAGNPQSRDSPSRLAREKELARLETLFAGSELGDDFMNSDMTMENALQIQTLPTAYPERPSSARSVRITNNAGRRAQNNGPARRYQAEMNDGFSKKAIETQPRQGNQHHQEPKKYQLSHSQQAAMREVRVARSRHSHGITQDAERRAQRRSAFAAESPDRDSMSDSYMGDDALDLTPRGRRSERPRYHDNPPVSPTLLVRRKGQDRKRRRTSPDYDDKALSQMEYSDLQNEPFDFDPSKLPSRVEPNGASSRIAQVQQLATSDQHQFFASMPINEWEESGDWFVDRFSDIMKRLREARRNKRQMIQKFEDEATEREELVRRRTDEVDDKLQKMKEDGLKVVGKKRSK